MAMFYVFELILLLKDDDLSNSQRLAQVPAEAANVEKELSVVE